MTTQIKTTWRRVKLGEVLKIRRGASPRPIHEYITKTGMPWLKIADVTISDSRYVDTTKEFIKEEGVSKSVIVKPGDLILSNSATPGIPRFMRITACVHDGWLILKPIGDSVDKYFLYYRLIIDRSKLISNVTGAIFDNLKTDVLRDHEISLPPIDDQKHIANILSVFDDKIDLNNKISKNLEQAAQAIFKEWFVKFKFPGWQKSKFVDSELGKIPEGWEVANLGDIADIQWGDTSTTKVKYKEIGFPAYSATGPDGYLDYYDFDRIGIVLSAIGANCGITWLARNKWSVIKNTIRFWSIDNRVSTEYLFLATMRQGSWPQRGSAQPFITLGDARKIKILVPTGNVLKQFNDFVAGAYYKIDELRLENQKLVALRDLLLPKLMSGEIAVKN